MTDILVTITLDEDYVRELTQRGAFAGEIHEFGSEVVEKAAEILESKSD